MEQLRRYVRSERDADRFAALQELAAQDPCWERDVALWQTMSLLPTRKEKSHLAFALRTPQRPDGLWALTTALVDDGDQDIVGNAINSMTFSRNRSLGHRLLPLYQAPEKPQRVFYCMARFAEEALDRRFIEQISPCLAFDVADAFLARSFNALFRLGVRDPAAIAVASELVASHINATNMDRKAAVAAVLYLCFAGGRDDVKRLADTRDRISIPELRRILNWGLSEISLVGRNGFNEEDALVFFSRALQDLEPNFAGFGCFEPAVLRKGMQMFLERSPKAEEGVVVRTVLSLGESGCTELMAKHARFGIARAVAEKSSAVLDIWRTFAPFECAPFSQALRNPENYEVWHRQNPELLFVLPEIEDFHATGKKSWQGIFEQSLGRSPEVSRDLLAAQILALERLCLRSPGDARIREGTASAAKNVALAIQATQKSGTAADLDALVNTVFGILVGGRTPEPLLAGALDAIPLPPNSWVLPALALRSAQLGEPLRQKLLAAAVADLDVPIQDLDCGQDEFVLHVASRLQSTLWIGESLTGGVPAPLLEHINLSAARIQAILDALVETEDGNGSGNGDDHDDEVADWSGHVTVDKSVPRWNAVVQACLNKSNPEAQAIAESILRESIRVAPHVEKRWVVRALARLNSDDSVKAILYQAFQHVDQDFVGHTIRELLPSQHPRAQQALIRCVGRNTIPDELKLLILDEISLANPEDVLRELRTLEILRLPQHIDEAIRDAVGRVAALIDVNSNANTDTAAPRANIDDVDRIISDLLPSSDRLSVDTRSALRTAEMILIQSHSWGTDAVDLSPIVNMHCKAVELAMRETLEPWTDALLRKGVLSRKLDILGYARPIPEKMQIFEDYLASLPIIKTIPYFSRFKLRKMLRAICLYRPGKRFTLDGPKAFALLFLVASRKQCSFGLANMLNAGFANDAELFEFIKLVHSLQDSRNRAVHEGLTWEAKDDIDSMRSQAYRIIEQTRRIGDFLQAQEGKEGQVLERGA